MSTKPRLTRKTRDGKVVPNEKATAFGGRSGRRDRSHKNPQTKLTGALQLGNADIVAWVSEYYLRDIQDKQPTTGRFTRVTAAARTHFNCSQSTALRAYRDAELIRFADAEARRPQLRDRVEEQLQRIADREEEREPMAAIAALREVSRIGGLYAPLEVAHTHTGGPLLDLRNLLDVLPERGRAALDVVLECMAELERAGRLLPIGASEDIPDAEIVSSSPPAEPEPGAN